MQSNGADGEDVGILEHLRPLLEDPYQDKLVFDGRYISDNLYHKYQCTLNSPLDIQILEVTRRLKGRSLDGDVSDVSLGTLGTFTQDQRQADNIWQKIATHSFLGVSFLLPAVDNKIPVFHFVQPEGEN
eukprot:sb/3475278/